MDVACRYSGDAEPAAHFAGRVVENRLGIAAGGEHHFPSSVRAGCRRRDRAEACDQAAQARNDRQHHGKVAFGRSTRGVERVSCYPGARRGDHIMPVALVEKSCTPCRGGIPPLTDPEAAAYHTQAPEWKLFDQTTRIERTYRFKNFREAFGFVD